MSWNGSSFLMVAILLVFAGLGFTYARRAKGGLTRRLSRASGVLSLLIAAALAPFGLGFCHGTMNGAAECPLLPDSFARASGNLAIFGLIALVTVFPALFGLTAIAALIDRLRRR